MAEGSVAVLARAGLQTRYRARVGYGRDARARA
jgi:hypothetical protein